MNMKTFKFIAIMLVLAESFASCAKDIDPGTTINVQYQKCECEREVQYNKDITEKNILLLDAEKVSSDELPWFSDNNKVVKYVLCDFTLKVAYFKVLPMQNWLGIGYICNFPFDYSWNIPKEGVYISFTAKEFESCQGCSGIPETTCSDIILTSLKIQTK